MGIHTHAHDQHRQAHHGVAGARATVWWSGVPLLLTFTGACGHVGYALATNSVFGWGVMFGWMTALGLGLALFLVTSWRQWHRLGARMQLFVLDAGGAFAWYWLCAPFFQHLVMTLTPDQVRINALAYFWEVPLVGGLAILWSQWGFLRLARYVHTGRTTDPRSLYRQAELLPLKSFARAVVVSVVAFGAGIYQGHVVAGVPMLEVYKGFAIGFVISIFLGLFYFLALGNFVAPLKSRLMRQYSLRGMVRFKFHQRVAILVVALSVGSLLLMTLAYTQGFQMVLRDTTRQELTRGLQELAPHIGIGTPSQDELEKLRLGAHGQVMVVDDGDAIPYADLAATTREKYLQSSEGVLFDNYYQDKYIAYKMVGDKRVVSVALMKDFYGSIWGSLEGLVWGMLLVMTLVSVATLFFVRLLSSGFARLTLAIERARLTGVYHEDELHTGDEFETVSRGISHFVRETRRREHQLRDEHARLNASISGLQLGIVMTDTNERIVKMNEAAREMLRVETAPSTLEGLAQELGEQVRLASYVRQSMTKKIPMHFADQSYGVRYFSVFVAPVMTDDGAVIGAIAVLHDTTEARVMQRSRDEFFSIASHELRTPLTAIRGNASMMGTFYPELLRATPELAQMIEDIKGSSERLIEIVNDFLDVSRLEQGKMQFKPTAFAIHKTIENIIYDMQSNLKSRHLSLTLEKRALDEVPLVWADEERTKQVIYNLVGNAAKFTEEGGVVVRLSVRDDMLKVSVTDTGPGIAAPLQKLLFRKFQQAGHSLFTRDATRGTGLGLYISKFIVESMGGRMWLEDSAVGVGSTFSFTIPVATKERASHAGRVSQVDISTGMTTHSRAFGAAKK